jgi:Flp pilus assembly protein TadG
VSRRRACRGVAMIEGALVFMVFAVLIAGIMELGILGFAANAVTFAAHRAARFASVRGSTSGHAATAADVRAVANSYASPLNPSNLTVTVTWLPDNTPGNSVEVTVAYALCPAVLPLSAQALSLRSTARQRVLQ